MCILRRKETLIAIKALVFYEAPDVFAFLRAVSNRGMFSPTETRTPWSNRSEDSKSYYRIICVYFDQTLMVDQDCKGTLFWKR